MQLIEKYKWLIVIVAAVVILGGLLMANSSTDTTTTGDKMKAADKTTAADNAMKQEEAAKMKAKEASTGTTTYTAQAGNSYTRIARKAVEAYVKATNSALGRAQIVAAETFLTQGAGSPQLNLGQKVVVNKAKVAAVVKKAQALNASQVAAWQTYVPYVDFDTSGVG